MKISLCRACVRLPLLALSAAVWLCGCQLVLDYELGLNQTATKVVARRRITRQELDGLVAANRKPDILFYDGSKDGMDYFAGDHLVKSGSKPNEHVLHEMSEYWLPSEEAKLPAHLPYGQREYYDFFMAKAGRESGDGK